MTAAPGPWQVFVDGIPPGPDRAGRHRAQCVVFPAAAANRSTTWACRGFAGPVARASGCRAGAGPYLFAERGNQAAAEE